MGLNVENWTWSPPKCAILVYKITPCTKSYEKYAKIHTEKMNQIYTIMDLEENVIFFP